MRIPPQGPTYYWAIPRNSKYFPRSTPPPNPPAPTNQQGREGGELGNCRTGKGAARNDTESDGNLRASAVRLNLATPTWNSPYFVAFPQIDSPPCAQNSPSRRPAGQQPGLTEAPGGQRGGAERRDAPRRAKTRRPIPGIRNISAGPAHIA